jgi:crossover junction endodeoxyribonuclease RuvC
MRVLGIDPGSRFTGWGVLDCQGARVQLVAWGRLAPAQDLPLADRLLRLADGLEAVLAEHGPDLAAIERVFHGRNTRSLIVLAEARGALLATLARAGVELAELAPAAVKSAVTGSGRADKQQVARMVRLQLGLRDAVLPLDSSDALAVALACGQSAAGGRLAIR